MPAAVFNSILQSNRGANDDGLCCNIQKARPVADHAYGVGDRGASASPPLTKPQRWKCRRPQKPSSITTSRAKSRSKKYRIAYLTECVDNPYCLARLAGLKAAAAKYGFEFKIFDANFSPATQAKVVENAVTEGFDGYLFGPAAAQPGCGLYNRLLKPTGKPIVSIDIAMCGDPDYTPGLAATLTMQGPAHFNEAIETAFASCTGTCSVAAVGGFVGSDLFTYWENAIKAGSQEISQRESRGGRAGEFRPAHRAHQNSECAARASRHQHHYFVMG